MFFLKHVYDNLIVQILSLAIVVFDLVQCSLDLKKAVKPTFFVFALIEKGFHNLKVSKFSFPLSPPLLNRKRHTES